MLIFPLLGEGEEKGGEGRGRLNLGLNFRTFLFVEWNGIFHYSPLGTFSAKVYPKKCWEIMTSIDDFLSKLFLDIFVIKWLKHFLVMKKIKSRLERWQPRSQGLFPSCDFRSSLISTDFQWFTDFYWKILVLFLTYIKQFSKANRSNSNNNILLFLLHWQQMCVALIADHCFRSVSRKVIENHLQIQYCC